jgi:hypothetical protein
MDMINLTVKAACVILNVRVDITRLGAALAHKTAQAVGPIPAPAALNQPFMTEVLVQYLNTLARAVTLISD